MRDEKFELLAKMPPGLSRPEVAKRLSTSQQAANRWIRAYGYKAIDGRASAWSKERRLSVSKVDWTRADWTKTNIELGRELGISREWVRVKRRAFGRPPRSKPSWIRQSMQSMLHQPKPEP